jgi:hypothetical protein
MVPMVLTNTGLQVTPNGHVLIIRGAMEYLRTFQDVIPEDQREEFLKYVELAVDATRELSTYFENKATP